MEKLGMQIQIKNIAEECVCVCVRERERERERERLTALSFSVY